MPSAAAGTPSPARPGFTLIELLVVIGIIALLVSIGLVIGNRVAASGRERVTQDTIRVMDSVLDTYMSTRDRLPPAVVDLSALASAAEVNTNRPLYPLADAFNPDTGEHINTVGLFLHEAERVPAVEAALQQVDASLITRYQAPAGTGSTGRLPELLTVLDGFGEPLRMVHPRFQGIIVQGDNRPVGQPGSAKPVSELVSDTTGIEIQRIRRNYLTQEDRENWTGSGPAIGDGDGGHTPGNRPYFYSPGVDKDPSVRDSNVYSTRPTFTDAG